MGVTIGNRQPIADTPNTKTGHCQYKYVPFFIINETILYDHARFYKERQALLLFETL